MSSTEAARAEAFASQADQSRVQAAGYLQQTIQTATAVRDMKTLVERALNSVSIQHRWSGTQLEILSPNGEWVTGPDLKGERGYGVTDAAVDEDYHLVLTFGDGMEVDAGYVRGLPGAAATIEVGSVTTLPPGSAPTFENVGTEHQAVFDIGIPQGAPGTGDVNGPAGAVNNRIVVFDLTTGKLIKDGGSTVADLLARGNHTGTQAQSTIVNLTTDLAAKLDKSGGTMTGALTLNGDPASALQAATKQYVDGLLLGVGKRNRVRVATTANITISTALNNGDTLDGVTLATGDLVLVKDQSTGSQNGIYVVGASPARSGEYDTWDEFPGSLVGVAEGTTNGDTLWFCTNNAGGTLGTTAVVFTQFRVSGELLLTDIGVSVQAYDVDTAKLDVDQAWSGAQRGTVSALTSGTTITPVAANGNDYSLTLAHNATLANFSDIASFVGQKGSIACVQDATGGRTLAFGSYWFPIGSASAPAIPSGANAKFRVDFHIVSSTRIDFAVSGVGV